MPNIIIELKDNKKKTKNKLEVYKDISTYSKTAYNATGTSGIKNLAIDKLINVDAIKNSLNNIFTWSQGERILIPEFGSRLRKLLYNGITDYNVENINAEIRQTISKWEPRISIVDIINIQNESDYEDNTVHLEIIYTIPTLTDKQFNFSLMYNKSE